MTENEFPIPVDGLLPHRPPMKLVDRLLEQDGPNGVVEAEVRPDNPLLEKDGRLTEVALVEMMAQSYAVIKGLADKKLGKPVKEGFLVAVKKLKFLGIIKVGDRVRIAVNLVADLDGFGVVDGRVTCGDKLVAEGNFRVYVP